MENRLTTKEMAIRLTWFYFQLRKSLKKVQRGGRTGR